MKAILFFFFICLISHPISSKSFALENSINQKYSKSWKSSVFISSKQFERYAFNFKTIIIIKNKYKQLQNEADQLFVSARKFKHRIKRSRNTQKIEDQFVQNIVPDYQRLEKQFYKMNCHLDDNYIHHQFKLLRNHYRHLYKTIKPNIIFKYVRF